MNTSAAPPPGNADTTEVVVIGSQALFGTYPDAPDELLVSREADVFPRDRPHVADMFTAECAGYLVTSADTR